MAVSKVTYATSAAITMDLSALATSSTLLAGRESSQIDNTTNLYIDALVQGTVIVGTTPTTAKTIAVYVYGSDTSLATTAIDVLDGTDSAETLTNAGLRNTALKFAAAVTLDATTSDLDYFIAPFSVASLFGGNMPKYWGLFVTHDTVAALKTDAGNTNSFSYTGITYTTT